MISPEPKKTSRLSAGEVGYVIPGVKNVREARVGDTMTSAARPAAQSLGGYRDPRPMVYSGLYPIDGDQYPDLRDALDRLQLNDASLTYEPETLGGARLRLPLRLPRPAAPGDRPRAARARVRPLADLDRAERRLPRGHGGRHRGPRSPTPPTGSTARSPRSTSRSSTRWCCCRASTSAP